MRRRTAFSLIELLIVVGIIAIIAAVLFPVFAQVRGKARSAACLSNMKQIGIGLMMYAQDYEETYPSVIFDYYCSPMGDSFGGPTSGNSGTGFCPWQQLIQPYLKSWDVLLCPSSSLRERFTASDGRSYFNVSNGNYTINQGFGYRAPRGTSVITLSSLDHPADIVFATDATDQSTFFVYTTRPMWWNYVNNYAAGWYQLGDRHNGGNNIVYADGHARWQNARQSRCSESWYWPSSAYTYANDLKINPNFTIYNCTASGPG